MNIFSLSGYFIALSTVVINIFIIFRGRKKIHYIWVIFCLTVFLWGVGVYNIGLEIDAEKALFWWKLAYVGVVMIPALYIHFIFIFLDKSTRLLFLFYPLSLLFLFTNIFTNLFIPKLTWVFDSFFYIGPPSLLYNIFVVYFFGTVMYAMYILAKKYLKSDGYVKNQIKYFLLATVIGFGGGVFAYLPVYEIEIYPLANILIALFPFIVSYAILKHRMMDIKIIFQSSLVYSILLSIIIAVYLLIIFAIDYFFSQFSEVDTIIAGLLMVLIGIFSTPYLERYFRKKTDRIFFKDKYDYGQVVYNLSRTLNSSIELKTLLRESNKILKNIFKIERIRFVLLDEKKTMDEKGVFRKTIIQAPKEIIEIMEDLSIGVFSKQDIENDLFRAKRKGEEEKIASLTFAKKISDKFELELFAPIYLDNKLIALLMLGKKMSGDIYGPEDYNLLKTFSYQAGIAIEKARLFEKVKEHSAELEKKVEQRTSEIQGLQEEQRQMIHEIAHGLQTPLTVLKAKLAEISNYKETQDKVLSLEKSIDRASSMVYKMLHLAKLESSVGGDVFKKINLSTLIEEMIEGFKIITAPQNIKIEHSIKKNVFMEGVEAEIEELINNLVSNAVKYIGKKSSKVITIELGDSSVETVITVKDNGIGIKKDDLEKLFKRFFRASDKENASIKGTGLGLVVSKRIVEKHGGDILINSELGIGTEFRIVFKK